MSGELRLVRAPLVWGVAAAVPVSGVAWLIRGPRAATSILIATLIVLANAGAAASFSALAGRLGPTGPALISLPSFTVRMAVLFGALAVLKTASFIDKPTFALAFGIAVTGVLVAEARAWKRTPWLALTLSKNDGASTVKETA